jgi:hypothetical protein
MQLTNRDKIKLWQQNHKHYMQQKLLLKRKIHKFKQIKDILDLNKLDTIELSQFITKLESITIEVYEGTP